MSDSGGTGGQQGCVTIKPCLVSDQTLFHRNRVEIQGRSLLTFAAGALHWRSDFFVSAPVQHVVFVCTGNVCRSPMAEGFLRDMVSKLRGPRIRVSSAGTGAYDGEPPSAHSISVMRDEGIDISDQFSQSLTPELVAEATHLFAMADSHRRAILAFFPEAIEKTFVLREFIVDDDLDLDVPDPIGMDREAYERTRNLIKEAMPSVLEFVLAHPGQAGEPPAQEFLS